MANTVMLSIAISHEDYEEWRDAAYKWWRNAFPSGASGTRDHNELVLEWIENVCGEAASKANDPFTPELMTRMEVGLAKLRAQNAAKRRPAVKQTTNIKRRSGGKRRG